MTWPPNVEAWRHLIEKHIGEGFGDPSRDVDRALAWIHEESGGIPSALGEPYEVGIFQLDLQDGPAWGGTLWTLHGAFSESPTSQKLVRALRPDELDLQVTSGLAYIQHARVAAQAQLRAAGLTWSADDVWCLTKLQHGLPGLPHWFLPAYAKGPAPYFEQTWTDFRAWVMALDPQQTAAINKAVAPYRGIFEKLFDNAEHVGYLPGPDGGG